MDLTGFIGIPKRFDDDSSNVPCSFDLLIEFDRLGYVMAAGTPGRDTLTKSGGRLPAGGIVPGHAYTILAAKEFQGQRLVRLRNPWGNFEWLGDWGDTSEL